MNLDIAIEVINNFLHDRMGDTRVSGFEGLVTVLFQQATGQEFRLSSSGRQSGRDAGSESGYGNSIKIEAKHYLEKTALNLRQLNGEIDEATESDPNLDIWVLATSRSVDEQIATSLDKHAETSGVEVVVLDFDISGLPRLAVLMAAFPDLVVNWVNRHQLQYDVSALRSALTAIADAPDFEPAKQRLFAKLECTIGFDSARRRIQNGLLMTLSDDGNAKSAFRQSLGIRKPDAQVVRRTGLNRQLDKWWDDPGLPKQAVVIGEEGTGKTWAAFDWAMGRVDRRDMPIVLPFAAVAQEITKSDTVETLLPRLLAKWTGVLDEKRWKRRLERWLSSEITGRPLILVIVDGLNERASVQWRPFFSTLLSTPWREKIAVLATDRPYHWRARCSMAGLASFCEITVEGYSDAELDRALSARQISRNEIPADLLPLISRPRYCRLVADHYDEMIAAGDFTRERLIYLEIKDRRASKLHYPLTDNQLFEIIRDLAERARVHPDLNPKDLQSLITLPGGDDANIYEEIVTGGLLIPTAGDRMTYSYKVEPRRLVFGFGMLLAQELSDQSSASSNEIEEFLTSWFEPQPDMDRKVEICGSAMFHALFHDGFPDVALRELIRYWLGLRNWADTAQSAFANYVVRRPEVFVDIAEEFWSSTRDSGAAQEFLGSAFSTHRDNPRVKPILVRAIERWMGFVHPLGCRFWVYDAARNEQSTKNLEAQSGQMAAPTDNKGGREEQIRKVIEAKAGCPIVPGEIEVAGIK